jgi:hypothetical protein
MLSLEDFRMRSASRLCQGSGGQVHLCRGFGGQATPVGSPLNLPALSLPNVPRTELRGFRCISNRNKVRIEIVPTHRKQRRATNSNRNSFRGSSPFNPDAIGISGQAKSEERSFRLRPACAELRRGSLPNSGGEQKSRTASLPSAALGAGRMTT